MYETKKPPKEGGAAEMRKIQVLKACRLHEDDNKRLSAPPTLYILRNLIYFNTESKLSPVMSFGFSASKMSKTVGAMSLKSPATLGI